MVIQGQGDPTKLLGLVAWNGAARRPSAPRTSEGYLLPQPCNGVVSQQEILWGKRLEYICDILPCGTLRTDPVAF